MSWATPYITRLLDGETVSFRPHGRSMSPRIESGQLCTVEPAAPESLAVGDVVLCQVGDAQYLHFVKAIASGRYQIGNNRGGINGWVGPDAIFGRLSHVQD
jgi:hypothetical protein